MCAERTSRHIEVPSVRAEVFSDPLGFIYEDHERIRMTCERLVGLAEDLAAEDASEVAASILDFLENEVPLHVADEEEDLFPLLERRCSSEDNIVGVLELLRREHRSDVEYGRSLRAALRSIAAGDRPADPEMFADYARAFAMLQRRHHAMENTIVMPLAFERLRAQDVAELGRRMAARRALSQPG